MSPDARIEKIKRAVEDEWRDPRVTAAYHKWGAEETEWGAALRDFMIERADLRSGLDVLDIGSAHGEPGLAIAAAVRPGRTILIDIAPDLLDIAAARAQQDGLDNVETRVADAHELPFPEASFDRVTARLAAMYFADARQALQEALRVLRPGGKAVYLVWGSFDQPMFRDIIGVIFKFVTPPEDEAGAPSPFKFAEPGSLSTALADAGFVGVREEAATLSTRFPGAPQQWWRWLVDTAAPVQTWMAEMSDVDREHATEEIQQRLARYYDGKTVTIPVDVIVATGRKSTSPQ